MSKLPTQHEHSCNRFRRRCSSRRRRCRRRLALGVMCRRRRGRVYPTTLQLAQGSVGVLQFLIWPEFTGARTVPVQCPYSARTVPVWFLQ